MVAPAITAAPASPTKPAVKWRDTVNDRLLRISEVIEITSLSRSQIYAMAKRGDFPKQISLGRKCSRWRGQDIAAWIAGQ
ncbi:helix-turn-helix transcriptional regulator [Novosphingobium sp. SL115]|uniref:helix-turn-helix transcriptional regulator n=1 Tax=Novosphingobium sp. SL115 TaxID=2995150 RepID=UPI003FA3ACE2